MSKYHAIPDEVDGIRFASRAEARRYKELKLLERAGKISGLKLQPVFQLHAGIKYIADFEYYENGRLVVEDVKGMETKEFRLKKRLLLADYPDLDFRIVRG